MNLYCNACFALRKRDFKTKYYITSCKHIICEQCLQEKCPVCGKKCKSVLIERNMPLAATEFFKNPEKLFDHFQSILRFRQDQERSLASYTLDVLPEKIKKIKKCCEGFERLDVRLNEKVDEENLKLSQVKAFLSYSQQKHTGEFTIQSRQRNKKEWNSVIRELIQKRKRQLEAHENSLNESKSTSNESNMIIQEQIYNNNGTLDSTENSNTACDSVETSNIDSSIHQNLKRRREISSLFKVNNTESIIKLRNKEATKDLTLDTIYQGSKDQDFIF